MMNWRLPPSMMAALLGYILFIATPAAMWAGLLTPTTTIVLSSTNATLSDYANHSYTREWPLRIGSGALILRNKNVLFAYAVGVGMGKGLLAVAASATTGDGTLRRHANLDNWGFKYVERSFGAGASFGLLDHTNFRDHRIPRYVFSELGFKTSLQCLCDQTSNYGLEKEDSGYRACGLLPNSNNAEPEDDIYIGSDSSTIVAIGVTKNWQDSRRILGVAAGEFYGHLDKLQWHAEFLKSSLSMDVDFRGQSTTFTP